MPANWNKRLERLLKLDPNNVDIKAWQDLDINPTGYYRVSIDDGDTIECIIRKFADSYNLDPSLVRTHISDIRFRFDYYSIDCREADAHFEYQLNAIELRQLLDRAIGECERAIKREQARAAKGPTKKQLHEQEEKQKRDAALAKLSAEDLKVLGIKR